MNPVQWFFLIGTVGVSLGFTIYSAWIQSKYALPRYVTSVSGCDVARAVLDRMGMIQVSVTPVDPPQSPDDYLASEGLFLEKKIYDGRGINSLVSAARQAFLKGQLSNATFWVHLKKKMTFAAHIAVALGWFCFILGLVFKPVSFFLDLAIGAFTVVMILAIFDLPLELEVEERTSRLLEEERCFQPHEFLCFKRVNQAVSFSALTCLIRVPCGTWAFFLKRK